MAAALDVNKVPVTVIVGMGGKLLSVTLMLDVLLQLLASIPVTVYDEDAEGVKAIPFNTEEGDHE